MTQPVLDQPGLDLVERFRKRIYLHWQEVRSARENANDLLCVLTEEEEDVKLMIVPRELFVAHGVSQGETFEHLPQILMPAHEREPKLPVGHGLWIVLHLLHGRTALMRLVHQQLWVKGGQA